MPCRHRQSTKWKREGEKIAHTHTIQNDLNVKMLKLFHLKSEIAIRLEENLYLMLAFSNQQMNLYVAGPRPSNSDRPLTTDRKLIYCEMLTVFHQFVYF